MPSGSGEETDVLEYVLPIVRRCLETPKHNIIKVLYIGNLVGWSLLILVQLIYCLSVSTVECWTQYGPMPLALLVLSGQCTAQMSSVRNFLIFRRKLMSEFCWDLDLVTPPTRQYILKLCKTKDRWFILLLLIVISAMGLIGRDLEPNLSDLFITAYYVQRRAPIVLTLAIWYLRFGVVISAVSTTCAPFYSYYFIFLIKIKAIILKTKIEHLSEELKISGTDNVFIKKRLKEIVEKHQEIIRLHKRVIDEIYLIYTLLTLCLIPMIVFTVETIFIPQFSLFTSICAVVTILLFIGFLAHEGQLVEDLMEQIGVLLYDLEWYNWDVSNMKTLWMFLVNASIPLRWRLVIVTDEMNHTYFKKIAKTIYTVFNLLRSLST